MHFYKHKKKVFAPTSAPTSWFLDTGNSSASWKDWNPKQLEGSLDRLEKTVRAFGGGAAKVKYIEYFLFFDEIRSQKKRRRFFLYQFDRN